MVVVFAVRMRCVRVCVCVCCAAPCVYVGMCVVRVLRGETVCVVVRCVCVMDRAMKQARMCVDHVHHKWSKTMSPACKLACVLRHEMACLPNLANRTTNGNGPAHT